MCMLLFFVLAVVFDRVWKDPTWTEEFEWVRRGCFLRGSWDVRNESYHGASLLWQVKKAVDEISSSVSPSERLYVDCIAEMSGVGYQCPRAYDCFHCRIDKFNNTLMRNFSFTPVLQYVRFQEATSYPLTNRDVSIADSYAGEFPTELTNEEVSSEESEEESGEEDCAETKGSY